MTTVYQQHQPHHQSSKDGAPKSTIEFINDVNAQFHGVIKKVVTYDKKRGKDLFLSFNPQEAFIRVEKSVKAGYNPHMVFFEDYFVNITWDRDTTVERMSPILGVTKKDMDTWQRGGVQPIYKQKYCAKNAVLVGEGWYGRFLQDSNFTPIKILIKSYVDEVGEKKAGITYAEVDMLARRFDILCVDEFLVVSTAMHQDKSSPNNITLNNDIKQLGIAQEAMADWFVKRTENDRKYVRRNFNDAKDEEIYELRKRLGQYEILEQSKEMAVLEQYGKEGFSKPEDFPEGAFRNEAMKEEEVFSNNTALSNKRPDQKMEENRQKAEFLNKPNKPNNDMPKNLHTNEVVLGEKVTPPVVKTSKKPN